MLATESQMRLVLFVVSYPAGYEIRVHCYAWATRKELCRSTIISNEGKESEVQRSINQNQVHEHELYCHKYSQKKKVETYIKDMCGAVTSK